VSHRKVYRAHLGLTKKLLKYSECFFEAFHWQDLHLLKFAKAIACSELWREEGGRGGPLPEASLRLPGWSYGRNTDVRLLPFHGARSSLLKHAAASSPYGFTAPLPIRLDNADMATTSSSRDQLLLL